MTAESCDDVDHHRPPTANHVRELIVRSLGKEDDVAGCELTSTIYTDRLAVSVRDHTSQVWRVHVLTEALP